MTTGSLSIAGLLEIFHADAGMASGLPTARRGRRTSSPPQLGQRDPIASAHAAQKVHSYPQMRAPAESGGSAAAHFSHTGFIASAMVTSSR
jgi:hypothetical protein